MSHQDPEIDELIAENRRRLSPGEVVHVARLYGEVQVAFNEFVRTAAEGLINRTPLPRYSDRLSSALREYKVLVPDYIQLLLTKDVDVKNLEKFCISL